MRLWTLHPEYLDRQGLLAVWREGLLAKHVLTHMSIAPEKRIGYCHHPQLNRFKATADPLAAIALYLEEILFESQRRYYSFDANKIDVVEKKIVIPVTTGQIDFERKHLLKKLFKRDPQAAERLRSVQTLKVHPLFVVIPGEIENWEIFLSPT